MCLRAPRPPGRTRRPLRYSIPYTREPAPGLDVEVFLPRSFRLNRGLSLDFIFRQPGRVESMVFTDEGGTGSSSLPGRKEGVRAARTRVLRYHYPLTASPKGAGRTSSEAWCKGTRGRRRQGLG